MVVRQVVRSPRRNRLFLHVLKSQRERTSRAIEGALAEVVRAERAAAREISRHRLGLAGNHRDQNAPVDVRKIETRPWT